MEEKEKMVKMEKKEVKKWACDEQTGRFFPIEKEKEIDKFIAIISLLYLLGVIIFFLWQLFDVWIGEFSLAGLFGYEKTKLTQSNGLICIYSFIGGCLGGSVNELRNLFLWHCDREAHQKRYFLKTIIAPFLGGTIGIFVYVLMSSGIALFSGEFKPTEGTVQKSVSMFALGALAAFGSRKIFIWFDALFNRIFKLKGVKESTEGKTKIPNLQGLSKVDAERTLKAAKLKIGEIVAIPDNSSIDKVIFQEDEPGVWVDVNTEIGITIGMTEKKEFVGK